MNFEEPGATVVGQSRREFALPRSWTAPLNTAGRAKALIERHEQAIAEAPCHRSLDVLADELVDAETNDAPRLVRRLAWLATWRVDVATCTT